MAVNEIELYLLESRGIVAKMNGSELGAQNGYRIIAGEENATQFRIASVPAKYEDYTWTVEMLNSQGYGIRETEIVNKTFNLPNGMAVAGYGEILITAKKTEEGEETVVPFNPIRVKVNNTITDWSAGLSKDALGSAKKYAEAAEISAAEASASAVEAAESEAKALQHCNDAIGARRGALESEQNAFKYAMSAETSEANVTEIAERINTGFSYNEETEELTILVAEAQGAKIYKHVFWLNVAKYENNDITNNDAAVASADMYMVFYTTQAEEYTWEEAKRLIFGIDEEGNPLRDEVLNPERYPVEVTYANEDVGYTVAIMGYASVNTTVTDDLEMVRGVFIVSWLKVDEGSGTVEQRWNEEFYTRVNQEEWFADICSSINGTEE